MTRLTTYFFTLCFLCATAVSATTSTTSATNSATTIAEYGQLPRFRSLEISPNGKFLSFIERGKENDIFIVKETGTLDLVFAGNADSFKARSTLFATNKHVLLLGSDTTSTWRYRGRFETSGALAYNLETEKIVVLLKGTKDIHPAQTGLGRIVGINRQDEAVYMPAYTQSGAYNLYRVNLNTGRGRLYAKGNGDTIDWFLGENGKIIAQEGFDKREKRHFIRSKLSGKWVTVFEQKTDRPVIGVRAVGADEQSLLFVGGNEDRQAIYSMSLIDGSVSGPLYQDDNADIDDLVLNIDRKFTAAVYSGFKPRYEFSDSQFTQLFSLLEGNFPKSSVHFQSWTEDKNKIIVFVSGGDIPGAYYLLNHKKMQITRLAKQYNVSSMGETKAIRYGARDGLKIPALLTLPPGEQPKKNLPLIVLPHGGPETYDQIGFDWQAQYYAAKGYAVLQPNFRGSTGFGFAFRNAGRGRWGREMQDDVSDGVAAVAKAGYVDPDRVCIAGGSYGGYSALAGGAFSAGLFRCIISVNGVSDVPEMLHANKNKYGKRHWVISYWRDVVGDSKTQIDALKAISPVNFASDFKAPVLLIHGNDDTVVPIKQSKKMYKALKKAGHPVQFSTLDGEDHWLSSSATRLQMLTLINKFLDTHNPVDINAPTQP